MSRIVAAARWLWGAAGVVLGAALLRPKSARASSAPDAAEDYDDGRPILVIGDSYAVGIAAALRAIYPGRDVRSVAVGGTSSYLMQTAPDERLFVIVSAGTNDVGANAPTAKTVDNILRVLGPYAAGTATKGKLFYVLPQTQMDDRWASLRGRVEQLRAMLEPKLAAWDRFEFGAPEIPPASPGDGLHFDGSGYRSIAQQAMHEIAPLGIAPAPASSGSKSGLLPNGDIDPAFLARARQVAANTGVSLDMLLAVMWFETGGTFKSDIKNAAGSGATGLIQWMPKYAPGVTGGKTVEQLAQMSAVEQLAFVEMYFKRFGSFASRPPADAYLAVFSPAMMGKADDYPFYSEAGTAHGGPVFYRQNAGLDRNKDGAITVGEVRQTILGTLAKVRAKGWT